jgi:pimeloyl-ACP methyl ester carboxylesterase
MNLLLAFLSRDWAGLAIAIGTALIGTWALSADAVMAGWTILACAGALAAGSMVHLQRRASVRRRFPPPGKRVDVGGYCMHVLAEGDARGQATVVWLPGGHAGGSHLHHLHDRLRTSTRSVLVDRPGTGWSDTGPFPRTTRRETAEVMMALEIAGERPPFLLAGHSFGGLLAANIARAYPDRVSCVALIDATPPDTIIYGPRHPALKQMRRSAWIMGLTSLFGLDLKLFERAADSDPVGRTLNDVIAACLGRHREAVRAAERNPGAFFAAASIFQELSPEGMARAAWDIGVYDGDLDHMPVLLVAPADMVELEANLQQLTGDGAIAARIQRIYARSRERYMATSRQARRIASPPGTGHNFPFEAPDFLADVIREAASAHTACATPGHSPRMKTTA